MRSLDEDMEVVGKAIHKFLKDHRKDHVDVTISDLTSMVFLGYTKGTKINWHTDQRYSRDGKFMTSQNSQEENTFVAVLTIGDTRYLHMKCVRYRQPKKKKDPKDPPGPIDVEGNDCHKVFELTNGSLFLLHPGDEVPFIRQHFDEECATFFQHSVLYRSKDGLSIALVFRTTSHTVEVFKDTGLLKNFADFKEKDSALAERLDDYAKSDRRTNFESHIGKLYEQLESRYLK